MSLAINPLENRWPIKSCVQGEPPLINADCQGASLMYFSFKESVSNAHCFGVFSLSNVSRKGGAGMERNSDESFLPDSSTFMDEGICEC